jgi:hypothetical protein
LAIWKGKQEPSERNFRVFLKLKKLRKRQKLRVTLSMQEFLDFVTVGGLGEKLFSSGGLGETLFP